MYKQRVIIVAMVIMLCMSLVMPMAVYAAPSGEAAAGSGLLNTLIGLLANFFHINMNPVNQTNQTADKPAVTIPLPSNGLPPGKEVLGFYAEWYADDTASYEDLKKHTTAITAIAPFWATLQTDGSVRERGSSNHTAVMKYAQQNHVKTLLMVNNAKQEQTEQGLHQVLANPALRTTAIDNLLAYLQKYNFDGINIDFEMVTAGDRDYLTAFMRELSARLKPQGLLVTIDVLPKHNEENDVAAAYDYAQLAQYTDKIILMTYDYHAGWNQAGPVADLQAAEQDVKYALTLIPKNKIYLGLASYGYDWSEAGTASLEYGEIQKKIAEYQPQVEWDEASRSPHFSYNDHNGKRHQIWYEDSRSTQYKLELTNRYDLGGVALWKLGDEDPELWTSIKGTFKK